MRKYRHHDRDEFAPETKRVLALRAAHRCSNPRCRNITARPHSEAGRAVLKGVAAHICAAALGGPRFDESQTPDERKAITNGIWVRHVCSDRIDKDAAAFSIGVLREWKRQHEAWVGQEDFVPQLPRITVQTYAGLVLDGFSKITGEMVQQYCDHEIKISASSRHELTQFRMRVQFPEKVVSVSVREKPVGVEVAIRPKRMEWVANASGGGSVTVSGPLAPTNCFTVEQERVIPDRPFRFILRTVPSEKLPSILARSIQMSSDDTWFTYAEGTFLYLDQGEYFEREFLVRLVQDCQLDERVTCYPIF
jgi:hypothetical protein